MGLLSFLGRLRKPAADERDIFEYHDGKQDRRIDPLVAWNKVWTDPECDPTRDIPASQRGDRESFGYLLNMTRRTFGLADYDQGGLTELETIRLFHRYLGYMDELKKKLGPPPMPLQSSESSSSPDPSATKPEPGLSSMSSESPSAAEPQSVTP